MENLSVRRDFLLFLRKPDYKKILDISEKEKLYLIFKVFILTLLGIFIVNILVVGLKKFGIISEVMMKTEIFIKTMPSNYIGYKPYFLISTIFLVPLLEEVAYRLCLTKFNVNYFIVSVSVLASMFVVMLSGHQFWIPKSYLLMSVIKFIYILLFTILVGSSLWLFRRKIEKGKEVWNKNAAFMVYFMSILFALTHLNNLKFEPSDLFFMPLILSPFFVYGLSFSYLRVRLGIKYSIFMHFVNLVISYGLPVLFHV